MTTSRPYQSQDTSAKNVSPALSARTVRDITRGELGTWVSNHHADFYSSFGAHMFSYYMANEYYNHKVGYAFPSIDHLAKKLNLSVRMVKYYTASMREARDQNGKPLWEIERGYSTKSGKGMANRYYPLFLRDILKGKPVEKAEPLTKTWEGKDDESPTEPLDETVETTDDAVDIDGFTESTDASADIEQDIPFDTDEVEVDEPVVIERVPEPLERVEVPAAELPVDEVQQAGSILRAALEAEKAKRDARAEELFPIRLNEQPGDLPQEERKANALRAVEEELFPADGWDTQFLPATLLDMDEKIRRFESHWFIPVTDARAPQMSAEQRYVAGLILTYWTRGGSLNATDKAWLEKCLVDTWLTHPETDVRIFYRRFMHYYQGEMNETASL